MTPEEHEQYIAQLEQRSEQAARSYRNQQRSRSVYPFLLLAAAATTAWLIYKTVEAVMQ